MRRLIVPISFAVMALAVAAMLPALVSAQTTDTGQCSALFLHNIGVGSDRSEDVLRLSEILVNEGVLEVKTNVFTTNITAAVVAFQAKYGIPTTGYVGPLTRAALNTLHGCNPSNTRPIAVLIESAEDSSVALIAPNVPAVTVARSGVLTPTDSQHCVYILDQYHSRQSPVVTEDSSCCVILGLLQYGNRGT